ncbi:MAG: hypothetical protein M3275_01590 [Thermoproteota archaeon]|nr:hypothetical protein [Thermoproteota archaeon]
MSSSSPSLTCIIIITIVTLTAILLLISSPVMTVSSSSSPLMVLKVGLASASSEGADGEQQQEGDNSQQQLTPALHETPPLQMPPAQVPPLQAPPVIVEEEPLPPGEPPAEGVEEEDGAETSPQPPAPIIPFTQQGQRPQPQVPGATSPDSTGTGTTFPGGISIAKNPNGGVTANIPDEGVRIDFGPNGVKRIDHGDTALIRDNDGGARVLLPTGEDSLSIRPDGTGDFDNDSIITGNRDGTLTIEKSVTDPNTGAYTGASMTTTYKPPP